MLNKFALHEINDDGVIKYVGIYEHFFYSICR